MTAPLFVRVLDTETLKLRRTVALKLVILMPMVVVVLYFVLGYGGAFRRRADIDVWGQIIRNTMGMWTLLMMPMYIAIQTALLADLEHGPKNWKSLLALPPPPWMFYMSKLIVIVAMLWGAHAVLAAGTLASGSLLRLLRPELDIGPAPSGALLSMMARTSIVALFAVAIQHFISLRVQTFTVALAFGVAAGILGFAAVNSPDFGPWYPWSMPMLAGRGTLTGDAVRMVVVALGGATLVSAFGCWHFARVDR